MVKKDLINRLAGYFPEFRKRDLEYLVDLFFARLTQALIMGERVEIRGFGRFLIREQKERIFINPKTNQKLTLRNKRRVIFRPGKDIKERLNQPAYASLDLGTQTFRLLIGKTKGDKLRILCRDRENVRLGDGLVETGNISASAMDKGIKILSKFRHVMDSLGVVTYLAIGTAVFRKASNREEFLKRAAKEAQIEIKILSPEEEASFTLKGILAGLKERPESFLVADVGGGSTELIVVKGEKSYWKTSLDLGAVTLTEKFFSHDPPTLAEIESAQFYIRKELKKIIERTKELGLFIITGGTASCLAALGLGLEEYVPEIIHGYKLSRKELANLFERLAVLESKDRLKLKGMERGREDIIISGLLIYLELMQSLNFEESIISESGILEGLVLHLIQNNTNI